MAEAPQPIPTVEPQEALRYFRDKGFTFGFAWQDVWQEEHARAFTVAKVMTRDLLEDIRAAVDAAIAEGKTLAEFTAELRPTLETKGWWGRRQMIDPLTAQRKTVQLGSPRRLATIYRVNMRTAYQAGRWERIQRQKKAFPYLRYTSVMDGRERPEHRAWHDTVLPIDHPWWDTHYPPCGWNCRCTAVAMNRRQLERRGLSVTEEPARFADKAWTNKRTGEVHQVEDGIDPGWSYNVGKAALDGLAPAPIGPTFTGSDIAAAGSPIAGFLDELDAAAGGRVLVDRGGWPLSISAAWFRDPGGRTVLPSAERRGELREAGRTIAQPDEIRWVWVRGEDGRALLFRRYLQLDGERVRSAVDVGSQGWRFVVAGAAKIDREHGVVAWSIEQSAIAAANPYQPREPKGTPGGGQFRSTGTARLLSWAATGAGAAPAMSRLGNASPSTVRLIEAAGHKVRSPAVWLEGGRARHALKRHGGDDRPVKARDLATVHQLLNRSTSIQRGNRAGTIRVEVGGRAGATVAVFEVRRRGIVLHTMYKRGKRKVSPS